MQKLTADEYLGFLERLVEKPCAKNIAKDSSHEYRLSSFLDEVDEVLAEMERGDNFYTLRDLASIQRGRTVEGLGRLNESVFEACDQIISFHSPRVHSAG